MNRNEDCEPIDNHLSDEAKDIWKEFYNRHNKESEEISGSILYVWSKLEAYAARLTLVLHSVKEVLNPNTENPNITEKDTLLNGIAICEWFKNEALRVYAMLSENEDQRASRELIGFIERKGGRIRVRDLQQSNRKYTSANDAEKALQNLASLGLGIWEQIPTTKKGGCPTKEFVLKN